MSAAARTEEHSRADRRARERERMAGAVEALRSSAGWARWLRARRAFHDYSFRNQLLIAMQCDGATHVAGFRAWMKIGYAVRKGESAIWIWARCAPSKKRIERWRAAGADPAKEPKPFYKMVAVFDRSQVEPIPGFPGGALDLSPPASEPICGDGLGRYLKPLSALAASCSYTVRQARIEGGAEALCDHRAQEITIEPLGERVSANAQIARLIHELAHMLVRVERREGDPALSYAEEEVVAECTAASVCGVLGLDLGGASVPYVAGWAQGDEIERYGELIDRLAKRIETAALSAKAPGPTGEAAPLAA